jgi:glycosyltransferase involved in cell wall biosynthesis
LPGRILVDSTDRALAVRDRAGVAAASTLACNSTYTAERVLASYGRSAEVVAPGVDESVFHPREQSTKYESPCVVSVGGLEPFKNHHVVVDALGGIPTEVRPRLVLAYERCDPRYRTDLLARAAGRNVAVIEHRGVTDDELANLYSGAAATVLAAQLEPLGLTALESIACGTPVVAVREAGYRETVTDGVNGVLVPRSIDALTAAITRVVTGRAGLAPSHDLPSSILPGWSAQTSVDRQLELLMRTAHG